MNLPKTIADLLAAQDKYDSKEFAENFSDDAIVHDEGKTYHGKKEIEQWNEKTNAKYKTKYKPLDILNEGEETIMTANISGDFDGSPLILKYYFNIKGSKITSLRVV
jgi:hypothetical protein